MVPLLFDAHSDPGFFVQMLQVLSAGLKDVHPMPRCIPSADGLSELRASGQAFNLLLPVLNSPGPHRGPALQQSLAAVASEVNAKACRVFLDFCNEATHPAELEMLVRLAKDAGIEALDQITLICQNRRVAELDTPIRHAGFDAFLVAGWSACRKVLLEENPDGDTARPAFHAKEPRHDILCLNATPRFHRLVTLLSLVNAGFINLDSPDYAPDCQIPYVSYPGIDYEKRPDGLNRVEEVTEQLRRSGLAALIPLLPRLLARTPLRVDACEARGNALAFEIDIRHYRDSKISVVTETGMGPEIRRITEKTLKPLALGQPCITIGHPHSLAMARELGYDTFDECIDNRYDTKIDVGTLHRLAMRSLGDFLARFNTSPALRAELKSIGMRNMRWTLDGFQAHYYEQWARPLLRALTGAGVSTPAL